MESYGENTSFIPGASLKRKLPFLLHALVILFGFMSFCILSAELSNIMFSLGLVLNPLLESIIFVVKLSLLILAFQRTSYSDFRSGNRTQEIKDKLAKLI